MIKKSLDFIFSLILVQFIFNYITILNIITIIIKYKFNNIYTMILDKFYIFINAFYSRYRFDKIDDDIIGIKNDIIKLNTKIDDGIIELNTKIDLILSKLN